MKKLSKFSASLVAVLSLTICLCSPALAVLNGGGHDSGLTQAQQNQIIAATNDYNYYHSLPNGDPVRVAGEAAAHAQAEAARAQGGSYSGGVDGTQYIPSGGGSSGGSSGGGGYTPSVTTYTITANAGTGGTISPSGTVSISSGGSQTYSIAANTGYKISDVKVDGSSVGVSSTFTFSSITSAHTISATFASDASINTGNVTLGDGGSGTLKNGITRSGYGITASLPVTASYVSGTTVTASYNFTSAKTVFLEHVNGTWQFPVNSSSKTGARKIYIPVETKDGTYTIAFSVKALDPQATALTGSNVYLTSTENIMVTVKGNMYEDDFTGDS